MYKGNRHRKKDIFLINSFEYSEISKIKPVSFPIIYFDALFNSFFFNWCTEHAPL